MSEFRGQVTLDGPSGTGKSSVARAVAARLGAAYLDTGAMYRAATVAVLDAGVSLDDKVAVARAVSQAEIRVGTNARREVVTVDGTEHYLDPATPDRLAAAVKEADGVLLLPGFDEYVLGYGDRTAVVPAEHAQRIVPGNNGMFRPTVVHRGQVVGTWKWAGRGAKRRVEAEPFTAFPEEVTAAVPKAAAALP